MEQSSELFPSSQAEKLLQNTSPAGQAKVFCAPYRPVQYNLVHTFCVLFLQDVFPVGHLAEAPLVFMYSGLIQGRVYCTIVSVLKDT
jgi:hypothetical protein